MSTLKNAFLALFRPAKGIDGALPALKWLWIPLMLLLVVSVAVKAQVTTPLQLAEAERIGRLQMEKDMASWPKEERVAYEESEKEGAAEGEVIADPGMGIVATAAMVFSVLGAVASVVLTATFFLVAARTWASPVGFTTLLSIASLSLVPSAARNLIQTAYMSMSGGWLQHAGLGDLVAPADPTVPPGALYALLSQVDIWALWGVAILFGALCSEAVGIGRKRAVTALVAFLAITVVLQAVPTLVKGLFMGAA